jgi:predicted ATPase
MEVSKFSSAYTLFHNGIIFLRCSGTHWHQHYHFSLEIFELAATTALAAGSIQQVQVLSDEVLRHARCFEDKLSTHSIVISSFLFASKLNDAINLGFSVLGELGEGISLCDLDNHLE